MSKFIFILVINLAIILTASAVISNILEFVKCMIPDSLKQNPTEIADFLQACQTKVEEALENGTCYDELGCFPQGDPWVTILRPLPEPYKPKEINTSIVFYSRNNLNGTNVTLWPAISMNNIDFDAGRPKTVFLTHGFASAGNKPWLLNIKDAMLKKMDANFFIVDWEKGSSLINYFQAASNTRIVGAEIARFGKYLIDNKEQNKTKFYMIGHSLGSHIMSYAAKRLNNETKVGRITGLDPAQPCFELSDPAVRLDKEDADFVDVYHTNARPFIPSFGFGMLWPAGHVDHYMNGGTDQPGCLANALDRNITSLSDLYNMTVEAIEAIVSCSHGRSYEYFLSALDNDKCGFLGRPMSVVEKVLNIGTLGIIKPIIIPIGKSLDNSEPEDMALAGLLAERLPQRGNFFTEVSNTKKPYCDDSEDFLQKKSIIIRLIDRIKPNRTSWTLNPITTLDTIKNTAIKGFENVLG